MKLTKRMVALAACLMLCMAVLAGCSGKTALAQKQPQEGDTVYQLSGKCTAEVKDGKVTSYLHSNLLEGTAVQFCLDTYDGTQLASATYSVSGEAISATFEMEPAWEGKLIYASVAAAPSLGKQPSAVTEAYGRYFQNIEGDCVIWNKSENIFLAQSGKIQL